MPDVAVADAPGRVNLIGEHTDYHEGFVLPTIIPQRTHVVLTRRQDRRVRATSAGVSAGWEEFTLGQEAAGRGWLDYLQGLTVMLGRAGVTVPGFAAEISSSIPLGAGVSSSAALTVSVLRALRELIPTTMDDVAIARVARAAETDFVGAPVGVMDQMASSLGRDGEALFIDTRTLSTARLSLPPAIAVVVIDSGTAHRHVDGGYVTRRRESFEAAALLGVEYLRDLDLSALPRLNALPPTLARRARHIITENQRVLDAVDALRRGEIARLGGLFDTSHVSMRDDYEISTPDVDALVAIARGHRHVHGARMTGGGFGGAVVLLADADQARTVAADIQRDYARRRHRQATLLMPPPR